MTARCENGIRVVTIQVYARTPLAKCSWSLSAVAGAAAGKSRTRGFPLWTTTVAEPPRSLACPFALSLDCVPATLAASLDRGDDHGGTEPRLLFGGFPLAIGSAVPRKIKRSLRTPYRRERPLLHNRSWLWFCARRGYHGATECNILELAGVG